MTVPEIRARPGRAWETTVWVVAALLLSSTAIDVATSSAGLVGRLLVVVAATAFVGSASVLLAHRPDNPISWLLALPPVYFAVDGLGDLGVALLDGRAQAWVRWAEQSLFAATMFPVAALLPVLFPTGRPPGPRWRWVVWVGAVATVALTLGNAVAPDLLAEIDGATTNPAAVVPDGFAQTLLGVGLVAFVAAFVGGVASLVVRTRHATGTERQQVRWVARAGLGSIVAWMAAGALESLGFTFSGELFVLGLALLPVAVAVAIQRYRLYDLDRVVSRTLTWTAVSGVLGLVYVGAVLASQQLLGAREVPDVVVAASTLAVAAMVRPLHTRLQVVVDARFNRTRLDADAAVARFGQRLRDDVDRSSVEQVLRDAVRHDLAPRSVSLWTPPPRMR